MKTQVKDVWIFSGKTNEIRFDRFVGNKRIFGKRRVMTSFLVRVLITDLVEDGKLKMDYFWIANNGNVIMRYVPVPVKPTVTVEPDPMTKEFPIVSLTREWMESEDYIAENLSDEYMEYLARKIESGLRVDYLYEGIAMTMLDQEAVERTCSHCDGRGCEYCEEDNSDE